MDTKSEPVVVPIIFGVSQTITYVMCAIRWFITDHYSFWHGFKELIWAAIPLVNYTYVWDWWLSFFGLIFSLFSLLG